MRCKRSVLIIILAIAIYYLAALGLYNLVMADELRPEIRNYPHPIICRPVKMIDGTRHVNGNWETWVVLTWAQLEDLNSKRIVFVTRDGKFVFPNKDYSCRM